MRTFASIQAQIISLFCYGTINSVLWVSLFPSSIFWKAPEIHQASGAVGSAAKKRQRSSPRLIIVIKDEPDDESSYVRRE